MSDLSTNFASALEAERATLNGLFSRQSAGGVTIDHGVFLEHLRESVGPLIDAIHAVFPERARYAVRPLFELSLELFAKHLLGPEPKTPWIARLWSELLPHVPRLIAREPRQVAGCLSNAIFQVATHPGACADQWLARMCRIGPQCQSLNVALQVGAIVAWQAGLAQFRTAALAAAARLPSSLAAFALDLPDSMSPAELEQVVASLRTNPWIQAPAARTIPTAPRIQHVATVGEFCGFGGGFLRPPVVSAHGDELVVSDGETHYRLLADSYGSWLGRRRDALGSTPSGERPAPHLDPHGLIRWDNQTLAQPHLAGASSQAFARHTLAVTIPTSYHIFLYALRGTEA